MSNSLLAGFAFATEILDCKPAATKCDLDPKTVHTTYQARFGGESQEVNLSRYPEAKPANNELLMKPITQDEIIKAGHFSCV
jgi:hypothetical protein